MHKKTINKNILYNQKIGKKKTKKYKNCKRFIIQN